MKKRIIALSILTSLSSFLSQAQNTESAFSYDTVSLGYRTMDIGGIDENYKGFSLKASKTIFDTGLFVFGEYYAVEFSDSMKQGDVAAEITSDLKQYDLGVGYKYSVSKKSDLFVEIAFGNTELSAENSITNASNSDLNSYSNATADDDFYRIGVGGRSQVYERFEMFAKVDAIKYSEQNSSELGWTVGGRYNITNQLDAEVSYFEYDDTKSWLIGASYRF